MRSAILTIPCSLFLVPRANAFDLIARTGALNMRNLLRNSGSKIRTQRAPQRDPSALLDRTMFVSDADPLTIINEICAALKVGRHDFSVPPLLPHSPSTPQSDISPIAPSSERAVFQDKSGRKTIRRGVDVYYPSVPASTWASSCRICERKGMQDALLTSPTHFIPLTCASVGRFPGIL